MQTTTTYGCQSKTIRAKMSKQCSVCGNAYFASHSKQQTCSLHCGQRLNQHRKTGLFDREKCATCHAVIGMNGALSGRLTGLDRSTVCVFRKRNGLKTLSTSQATLASNLIKGKSPGWMAKAWNAEWLGVVENYWRNDLAIARMCDPDMRGRSDAMVLYYLNLDESRRKACAKAKERYRNAPRDGLLKIKRKLRNHIARVCRRSKTGKTRKTIEYLGCDMNAVRLHIQKQFKTGMNWNNHGQVWEIDHIIPISLFDLLREDQRLRVNHFTNLRPEFVRYNREKGNRMVVPHQLALL